MNKFLYFVLVFIIYSSPAIGGADRANITPDRSIDVPDKTVNFENKTFEIIEIGSYKTSQDIGFTVDAPGTDDMLIVLYDKDKLSTWFERFSNTGGHVVAMIPANKTGEAGTYALVVMHERSIVGAMPIVISDYDLTVTPGSKQVIAGKTLDVEVKISKNGSPSSANNTVKVVLAKGSSSIEAIAQATKAGVYEAHIGIPLSANGTFSLYAIIPTERIIYINYPEIIGIENGGYIEILPPPAENTPAEKVPFIGGAAASVILLGAALLMRKRL